VGARSWRRAEKIQIQIRLTFGEPPSVEPTLTGAFCALGPAYSFIKTCNVGVSIRRLLFPSGVIILAIRNTPINSLIPYASIGPENNLR
jgi:hypothetical protein